MKGKWLLFVDLSPLWELQFTGVSNVVYELSKRLLKGHPQFDVQFSVFHRVIDRGIIEQCVHERSGRILKEIFVDVDSMTMAAAVAQKYDGKSAGLYLHIKPENRAFDFEAQLYYDFSFISVPECHHQDTVDHHVNQLTNQVLSNDIIFTISESTAKDVSFFFGYPRSKTHVVLLGYHVDIETAWQFSTMLGGKPVEPYFICVGSIEPRKNIRLILAWLSENPWALREFRFLFVGRDAWGESFDQLIEQAGLGTAVRAGRIVHVGYVTDTQKTALIVGARGLLFASLFEGFGLPVLEAMALGVPIAASCTTSVPEVLGSDGIYFDPYSVDSFDNAMQKLLDEHESGAVKLRCRQLQRRAQTFSYDRCYDLIMSRLVQSIDEFEKLDLPLARKTASGRRNVSRKKLEKL